MANKHKKKNKDRPLWIPYYERVTKNKKIYNRKEKHKGKDFYIHCRAGKSRSIAVATYILDMYGEEYGYNEKESCRKDNPCKTPNINVLTKLKRTYYKKFNIYES